MRIVSQSQHSGPNQIIWSIFFSSITIIQSIFKLSMLYWVAKLMILLINVMSFFWQQNEASVKWLKLQFVELKDEPKHVQNKFIAQFRSKVLVGIFFLHNWLIGPQSYSLLNTEVRANYVASRLRGFTSANCSRCLSCLFVLYNAIFKCFFAFTCMSLTAYYQEPVPKTFRLCILLTKLLLTDNQPTVWPVSRLQRAKMVMAIKWKVKVTL